MLSSADLPGKALMANMKQYNGEQGCSVCEDKGKTVGTGGLHRIWPYIPPIWSSEPTRLWLNQSAKLFRLENQFVS